MNELYVRYADQLSPITEMKKKMLQFYHEDRELRELISWAQNQDTLKDIQSNITKGTKDASPPLKIIGEQCKKSAKELANNSVTLCVYGNVNVGKSTFCNLLLGKNFLHVTHIQCTAVITSVYSATEDSTTGSVLFDKDAEVE